MAVSLHLPSAESSKSRVPGVALWKDDERCKTNAQHNSLQRYVEFHILGSSCAGNLCARESHRSEGNAILEEMTQEEQGKKKKCSGNVTACLPSGHDIDPKDCFLDC